MYKFGGVAHLNGSGGAAACKSASKSGVRLGKKLYLLSLFGLSALAISGFSHPVHAERITIDNIHAALQGAAQQAQQPSADKPYSALLDFVQIINAEQPKPISVAAPDNSPNRVDDQTFSALRDFAQGLGSELARADEPKPIKLAARATEGELSTLVGSKTCLTCHSSQTAEFGKTLMGRIGKTPQGKGKFECENCHGPGSAHVKAGGGRGVGGIISFRPNDSSRTAEENNGICLACHERGARTLWQGSTHETRGLMCTNCHTVMQAVSRKHQLKTAFEPDTCFQCHKDIRARVSRSEHMPVRESKMVCSDCHSPHGSYSEHLLKKATVNDVCFQCHADKRGPFLWEHPPVVESCLNCHDPHGSINENMLKVSRPRLCQRCHNAATRHPANPRNPMQIQAINSGCVNCHSQIHGSNSPGGQRFLR